MTVRRLGWTMVLVAALAVAGCGSDDSGSGGSGGGGSGSKAAGFPLTITNCGRQLTFTKPPERAITTFQPTLETMLALGLQDKIVGREDYTEGPRLPEQEAAFKSIRQISKPSAFPSKEVMLSLRPDFVISDTLDNFNASSGAATEDELKAAGAQVYIQSGRCKDGQHATFQDDYNDLTNLAKIFGVPERAAPVIAKMKAMIAKAQARIKGSKPVRLIFYDYKKGPLSLMTAGLSQVVQDAGGDNLTKRDDGIEVDVSVEKAVQQNPEVILLWDYGKEGNADSIKYLKRALATTDAVKNNKLIPIEGSYTVPGYKTAFGVEKVARLLHPDAFR